MELETLVGSVGFPVVMCFWFMYRTEKVIQSNTRAVDCNTNAINALSAKLKSGNYETGKNRTGRGRAVSDTPGT